MNGKGSGEEEEEEERKIRLQISKPNGTDASHDGNDDLRSREDA